jgi:transcriptional regulator with XRE-family HTH domain
MGSVVLGFPGGSPPPPRPLLRATIGDVLRRTRRAQGRTLADVAAAARVSLPYLSELERGLKEGSSEVLAAICDALGIQLPDLLVQAARDLFREAARRDQVIRLDAIRTQRAAPRSRGHVPAAPTMRAA